MDAAITSVLGSVPLKDAILTIGRSPNNDLFINHKTVSRHHAEVRLLGRTHSIVDLGSTAGTFVNGEKIVPRLPHMLHAGDAIQIGSFPLLYEEKHPGGTSDPSASALAGEAVLPTQPRSEEEMRAADGMPQLAGLQEIGAPSGAQMPFPLLLEPSFVRDTSDMMRAGELDARGSSPAFGIAEPVLTSLAAAATSIPFSFAEAPRQTVNLAEKHLQFTAFYPRAVSVESWHTLLVYAHVEAALEAVRAHMRSGETERTDARPVSSATHGTRITVLPVFQGVTFQPEKISFTWSDDYHPAAFRFSAERRWTGASGTGEVLLLAGPLIIASLRIPLRFAEADAVLELEQEEISVARYKNIFTSYSHADEAMIQAIRQAYQTIGDESFQDLELLRADQQWSSVLSRAIDSADVFQLFWSPQAAQSQCVYQECQYALQHYKYDGFIRPIYWEKPLTFVPPEFSHLNFTYYESL